MVTLVKEIGSDALFGLLRVLEGEDRSSGRRRSTSTAATDDLAVAVAQTDVKGDRSQAAARAGRSRPSTCTSSRSSDDGIVVRGAKCHTSHQRRTRNEIIVLPDARDGPRRRRLRGVASRARSNTPGLSLYVSAYGARRPRRRSSSRSRRSTRCSRRSRCSTTCSCPGSACSCAASPSSPGRSRSTPSWSTTASPRCPTSCRCSTRSSAPRRSIAEMNGVAKAGHIRDKLTQPGHLRGDGARAHRHGRRSAAQVGDRRHLPTPTPLTTNMAKYTFATRLPRRAGAGAGLRRRAARHRPGRRRLGQPRGPAGAGEVSTPPRRPPRSGSRLMNTHHRPHRPRLRRLPRRARGARRRLDRGREDADLPGLRARTSHRLREASRRHRLDWTLGRSERTRARVEGRRYATRGVRGCTGVPLPLG